ncbi:hypothetical protein [Sphingomonas hengshuiensis]|uniref:Uncharacterized protein n=1 Tax=Sphingomonas hengshuiensis TaxID=1609977 RepID=A0A7U4LFI3_9SPHN|nr:hypothetical protein [Sphingomonas hengshuiensis]AJP72313.1 hypothetical protein TS85_11730 [Sphingomonas hengshuiensis]
MIAPGLPGGAASRRSRLRFRHALVWLLIGSLVYAIALAIVLALYPDPMDALAPVIGPSLYLTPVFGMPYLIASARQRGWGRRLVYFTLLLTAAHIVANELAWRNGVVNFPLEPGADAYVNGLITGAIGGSAGSVLAFAGLFAIRIAALTRSTRAIALAGIGVLTTLGAFGMAEGLALSHALELPLRPSRFIFWYECVHLPWQAAFAVFVAWLMRLGRPTGG